MYKKCAIVKDHIQQKNDAFPILKFQSANYKLFINSEIVSATHLIFFFSLLVVHTNCSNNGFHCNSSTHSDNMLLVIFSPIILSVPHPLPFPLRLFYILHFLLH